MLSDEMPVLVPALFAVALQWVTPKRTFGL